MRVDTRCINSTGGCKGFVQMRVTFCEYLVFHEFNVSSSSSSSSFSSSFFFLFSFSFSSIYLFYFYFWGVCGGGWGGGGGVRGGCGNSSCRSGGRILFSGVNFLCRLLFRYPFHHGVTGVAGKIYRSFCQRCRWQVAAKHACTLRMRLCMK